MKGQELLKAQRANKELQKNLKAVRFDRDELKLKEEIAYQAKEIAEGAYQKVTKDLDGLIADNVKSEGHLYRELLKAQKELQDLKEALNKFNIIFDGKILYDLRETIGEDKWNALSDCYDKLTKLNP